MIAWMKTTLLLFAFSIWEYWLGKTKKLVAASSWELLSCGVRRLLGKRKIMDTELVQGPAGDIKLTISGGKIRLEGAGNLSSVGGSAGAFIQEDGNVLLDKLFAEIEAKSPAGAVPIEETVKALLKSAVASI